MRWPLASSNTDPRLSTRNLERVPSQGPALPTHSRNCCPETHIKRRTHRHGQPVPCETTTAMMSPSTSCVNCRTTAWSQPCILTHSPTCTPTLISTSDGTDGPRCTKQQWQRRCRSSSVLLDAPLPMPAPDPVPARTPDRNAPARDHSVTGLCVCQHRASHSGYPNPVPSPAPPAPQTEILSKQYFLSAYFLFLD